MEQAEIKKNGWVAWSEDEVKLLKRLFPHGRAREIAEQIGRPLTAVRQKAYSMGIKTKDCRLWSANEIKLLKKLYPTEDTQDIADKLGRSLISIKQKACNIGLKKAGIAPACVWSRQEEALLRKLHPDNSIRGIKLPTSAGLPSMFGFSGGQIISPGFSSGRRTNPAEREGITPSPAKARGYGVSSCLW